MSFAVIETGGKQYKVSASNILEVEKLDSEKGKTIKFKKVLLLNDDKNTEIGNPNIEGAVVEAKLLDNVKDRTVLIFHKRRRKHSRKKNGHRQRHSKIQITKILQRLLVSRIFFQSKKMNSGTHCRSCILDRIPIKKCFFTFSYIQESFNIN